MSQIAKGMRSLAGWLNRVADRLSPDDICKALDRCYAEQEFRQALKREAEELRRIGADARNPDGTLKPTAFTRKLRAAK